ncbi:MAG TPA: class II glutamine amidotransferase [Solirubrobacteraceae bacterium]|nr:class II glutamine amidotransferase [Solirubrobacteraceae bacterium]
MCRFLAYAAPRPASITELVPRHLQEFIAMARKNADGWGMGYRNGNGGPFAIRSLLSAEEDDGFMAAAARRLGDTGIVHLRSATPPLAVDYANSHPFVHGDLMMAHNGAIFPQQSLDEILPPAWRGRPEGTTDSERYFLAIVAAMEEGCTPVEAIRRTVVHILDRFQPSCLNAFLVTPDTLYATSWHQEEPYPDEYYRLFTEEELATYFHLRYRVGEHGLVIASTGWGGDDWHTISAGHVLEVRRLELTLTEHDLFSNRHTPLDRDTPAAAGQP